MLRNTLHHNLFFANIGFYTNWNVSKENQRIDHQMSETLSLEATQTPNLTSIHNSTTSTTRMTVVVKDLVG